MYPCMFKAMNSSALQLLTQYPSAGCRVCTISELPKEDSRVALVEKAYFYLAEKRWPASIHKVQHSIQKLCGINFCFRPAVMVCDMETKLELLE